MRPKSPGPGRRSGPPLNPPVRTGPDRHRRGPITRPDTHDAAFALVALAIGATVLGAGPNTPLWVRWAGLAIAVPAIALFIATAPRSTRR